MSQQARRLITNYLLSEGGEADKTAMVEVLQDALDIQQNSAESYVSTYCETWTVPEGTQRVRLSSLCTVESTDYAARDKTDVSTQSEQTSGVPKPLIVRYTSVPQGDDTGSADRTAGSWATILIAIATVSYATATIFPYLITIVEAYPSISAILLWIAVLCLATVIFVKSAQLTEK